MNRSNSFDVNCGPLSETNCSGKPYRAKSDRRMSMVVREVDDVDIIATSGHLQCALTTTKTFNPKMARCSRHEYASKGHPAISMDVMGLLAYLADSLGKPHTISLNLLWLNPGSSPKNNFVLWPSYGLFRGGFHAGTVRAVLAMTWE